MLKIIFHFQKQLTELLKKIFPLLYQTFIALIFKIKFIPLTLLY